MSAPVVETYEATFWTTATPHEIGTVLLAVYAATGCPVRVTFCEKPGDVA